MVSVVELEVEDEVVVDVRVGWLVSVVNVEGGLQPLAVAALWHVICSLTKCHPVGV